MVTTTPRTLFRVRARSWSVVLAGAGRRLGSDVSPLVAAGAQNALQPSEILVGVVRISWFARVVVHLALKVQERVVDRALVDPELIRLAKAFDRRDDAGGGGREDDDGGDLRLDFRKRQSGARQCA